MTIFTLEGEFFITERLYTGPIIKGDNYNPE
jgi:hypothetical protein